MSGVKDSVSPTPLVISVVITIAVDADEVMSMPVSVVKTGAVVKLLLQKAHLYGRESTLAKLHSE